MDFPIKNGGSFNSYVSLPEGISCYDGDSSIFKKGFFKGQRRDSGSLWEDMMGIEYDRL